jgi:rubrerythrin
MMKVKREDFADFLRCASVLEEKTYLLYKNLADPVEHLLIKALLLHIACDSQKHSAILKGISETIAEKAKPPKHCEKKLGGAFATIERIIEQAARERRTFNAKTPSLIEKLTTLESTLGEEYFILVQLRTLQFMTKEIREIYNVDIEDLKDILQSIIEDEENHEELLSKMKRIMARKTDETEERKPSVRYESPDAWTKHIPAGIT